MDHPVITRSYAASLWLVAKGYDPLSVDMSRDGSGGIVFRFPPGAESAMNEFHIAKDRLNELSLAARGLRS